MRYLWVYIGLFVSLENKDIVRSLGDYKKKIMTVAMGGWEWVGTEKEKGRG
jgi:hypothetical protein